MAWPLSQDYNEAVQNPASSFADAELRGGQAAVNSLGVPLPRSGNFADVYEFAGASGARWALKCFTREVPGLRDRYAEISGYLRRAKLPFTVDFQYLEQGIRIRGLWYPVLKMQWVAGQLLNEFVRNNLEKPALIDGLGQIWLRMGRRLAEAGIAHADLQHGNVILIPGRRASALAVKLIDYDGMFVPALADNKSGEAGHPAYQHPQRIREGTYRADVDRLPLLVVGCALSCLSIEGRRLWDRYDNGDNLLFREADLSAPGESALFRELWNIRDAAAHDLVGHLTLSVMDNLERVPPVHELARDGMIKPLTAAEEDQVTAVLGPGANAVRAAVAVRAAGSAASPNAWESLDDDESAPRRGARKLSRKWILVPLIISSALAAMLVGGLIFFLLNKRPKSHDHGQEFIQNSVPRGKEAVQVSPPMERERQQTDNAQVNTQPAQELLKTFPADGPEIPVPSGIGWDHVLVSKAEVTTGMIRIDRNGFIRTKQSYAGPVEVIFEARAAPKMFHVDVHGFSYQCPVRPSQAWHTFRLTITSKAFEWWTEQRRRLRVELDRDLTKPGPVFVRSDDTVTELRSLTVRPCAEPVVIAAGAGGVQIKEEIDCSQQPRCYQIGKNFQLDKDWRLSLDYWVPVDNSAKERVLFLWGDNALGKAPIRLTRAGTRIMASTLGHGYYVDMPATVADKWITIHFDFKPSARKVALDLGEGGNRTWVLFDVAEPRVPGLAWVGGPPGGPGCKGRIRALTLENVAGTAIAAKSPPKVNPNSTKPPAREKRARLPVPTAKALVAAEKQVRQVYGTLMGKDDPNSRQQLLSVLREQAKDSGNPALRYYCLHEAQELALQNRDLDTALSLAEEAGQDFDIKITTEMIKLLDAALRAPKRNFADRDLLLATLKVMEQVKRDDAFSMMPKLATAAQLVSLRNPKERRFAIALDERLKSLAKIEKEYKKTKELYSALEAEPANKTACKGVGRYRAFIKQGWSEGLPLLAASGDLALAAAAQKDLANPQEPEQQIEVGDRWLALAEREVEPAKSSIQRRAKYWFVQALFQVPDDRKAAVAERLKITGADSFFKPGLQGEYHKGGKLIKQRIDYQLDFTSGFSAVDRELSEGAFTARWKGYLWLPQPRQMDFMVQSAGTFDVNFDSQMLLSSAKKNRRASRFLLDGLHPLEITYRNAGGIPAFEFSCRLSQRFVAADDDRQTLYYHFAKKKGQ